jgi:hypothetical protein
MDSRKDMVPVRMGGTVKLEWKIFVKITKMNDVQKLFSFNGSFYKSWDVGEIGGSG